MTKISIIIPIYNAEKYLKECLDSVVNQTLKDIEIICVNDGSTDNSLEIINEYAQKDSRIIVINKENAGMGAAYNSGLKIAQGEYIGFVEPDDYIDLNMYEDLYNDTSEKPNIVKSNYYQVYGNKIIKRTRFDKYDTDKIYNNFDITNYAIGHIAHWSAIYKKVFLDNSNIKFLETSGAAYQDVGFGLKTYLSANTIKINDNAYYYYREHEEQSVKKRGDKQVMLMHNEWLCIFDYAKKNKDINEKVLPILVKTGIFCFLSNYRWRGKNRNWKYIQNLNKFFNSNEIINKYYDSAICTAEENMFFKGIKYNPIRTYIFRLPIIRILVFMYIINK